MPLSKSQQMSRVKGKNTGPEIFIRRILHKAGFRFRLHAKELPGRPDIKLTKYKAVILINGCFWHGHGCFLFSWPGTEKEFWIQKILSNVKRDRINLEKLKAQGWRPLVIWGCALKGKNKLHENELLEQIVMFLQSELPEKEITGKTN